MDTEIRYSYFVTQCGRLQSLEEWLEERKLTLPTLPYCMYINSGERREALAVYYMLHVIDNPTVRPPGGMQRQQSVTPLYAFALSLSNASFISRLSYFVYAPEIFVTARVTYIYSVIRWAATMLQTRRLLLSVVLLWWRQLSLEFSWDSWNRLGQWNVMDRVWLCEIKKYVTR